MPDDFGIARKVHQDFSERTTTFEIVQDVEPILEHNKKLQSIPQKSDWGRHVASIPLVIIDKWLREEWDRGNMSPTMVSPEFKKLVKRKLQDPDWRFLRTDK